jgi:hypothetical protein
MFVGYTAHTRMNDCCNDVTNNSCLDRYWVRQIVNCLRKQLILCSDTKIDAAEDRKIT